MCKNCGCETGNKRTAKHHGRHAHRMPDGAILEHTHDEAPSHGAARRTLTLEEKVLARNDALAAENRAWMDRQGVVALNLISSPGTGKTLLLEKTLARLRGKVRCAVITGDQQTNRDARRLRGKGAPVLQIETGSACHLNAGQIAAALPKVVKAGTRILFIENVGNLVCPAAFDLGEHLKIALLSTAEGEDKPIKYPALFSMARAVVLTKMDLAEHLPWDVRACRKFIRQVQPGASIFELSALAGTGMDAWMGFLESLI